MDRSAGKPVSPPLVLLQHFRGNFDNWDPALIDALSAQRDLIAFNNAGVASSTWLVADTMEQMARDAIRFIDALGLEQVDLLGLSIGGAVVQEIALRRQDLVRAPVASNKTSFRYRLRDCRTL